MQFTAKSVTHFLQYSKGSVVLSGMSDGYDRTGALAEQLHDEGYDILVARGFYHGKYEPALIVQGLSLGRAIDLARDYKQEEFIFDGMRFYFELGCVKVQETRTITIESDILKPVIPGQGWTEVLLANGEKIRFWYE